MQHEALGHVGAAMRRGFACGDECRRERVFHTAGIGATKPGEAVEQRRGAGTARTEYGDTLTLLHFEAGASEHPDARRASRDAGGVALPEGTGAKDDWHARTVHSGDTEPGTETPHTG